jgi:hypothetical protein
MPLPEGRRDDRTPWPPRRLDPVWAKQAEWAAWYSGDPRRLSELYGGDPTISDGWVQNRSSQYRGGIVGAFSRMVWGKPVTNNAQKDEDRLHVPIAGDIASISADLLFGEPPKLTSTASQDQLDNYIEDGLFPKMREAAEAQSGIGGVYLVNVWDKAIHPRPWITAVQADVGVSEFSRDRLSAVTFWRVMKSESGKVWRHLERHEPGRILHALYEGTNEILGQKVPLVELGAEYPDLLAIAASLSNGDVIETGLDRLTVRYCPNMLPNRIWREVPGAAPIGRSDYAGIEDLMASLDFVWTSWLRDIDLARSRLIVPQNAVDSLGEGQGAVFDSDRKLLLALSMSPSPDQDEITMVQFTIRVEEHERTTAALTSQIVNSAGYSAYDYSGESEGSALTATEIVQKRRKSLMTRDKKIQYVSPELAEATLTNLMLERSIFGRNVTLELPDVEFPDGVSESPQEVAQYVSLLESAKALSVDTKVRMVHPDWDDARVEKEVAAIIGSDLAQQAQGLSQIGTALTSIGTAVSLGALSQADADALVKRVTGVDMDMGQPATAQVPSVNGRGSAESNGRKQVPA